MDSSIDDLKYVLDVSVGGGSKTNLIVSQVLLSKSNGSPIIDSEEYLPILLNLNT